MADVYVVHEGAFGRAAVMKLREGLVEHAHSDAHIVCWLGGSPAMARIGTTVVHYSESQASGTNAYEPHDFTLLDTSRPAVLLALYISQEWLDQRREATGRPFVFTSPQIPIDPALRGAASRVANLLLDSNGAREAIDAEISDVISAAIDASSHDLRPNVHGLESTIDLRLLRALTFMRAHLRERIELREVASQAGLSRAHFFTLFRHHLHTTPQVFWSAIRLEEAIDELIYSSAPLTTVAFDLGFSASSNFSRFFKEHTGASPAEYRRASIEPSHRRQLASKQS